MTILSQMTDGQKAEFGAAVAAAGGATARIEKLRRLARTAVDPSERAPWRLPAAWAPSTTYYAGEVVAANGYWWVAQNGSSANPVASAASGTGPNAPNSANVVVDGTVNWLLVGAPTAAADDPQAPVITRSGSAPTSPNNIPWGRTFSPQAAMVRLYGGYQSPAASDRWRVATFDRSASSTTRSSGGRIGFWCDAASITLLTDAITGGSEGPFRVVVDGRYLTPSAFSNAGAVSYTTIAWGTRKPRYYEIEGYSREGFFASTRLVYTTASDLVWLPSTTDDLRAYWISDSQSASAHNFGGYLPGGGLPFRVARQMGWNDLWNASIGGTGWTNPGTGPFYTFRERVTEGLTRNPDVWVFYGSTNDNGASAASITAEVVATIQAIRAGGSKVPIFMIGVEPINAASSVTEAAIQTGVMQAADSAVFFTPLATASPYPVMIGAFNRPASLDSNVNTVARDVNSTDNVHLLESAISKRSRQISDAIKTALA